MSSLDVSDNAHGFDATIVAQAPLFDNGERCIETVGESTSFLGKALARGHNCKVLKFQLREVTRLEDLRGQFINRYVEEALDLSRVHIHGQDALSASDSDAVCDQASRDRNTRLIFLIGAPIGIVRNDSSDTSRRGTFERIDHDEQFHDRAIDRSAKGLNNKNISATDILIDLDKNIFVAELKNVGITEWNAQFPANRTRKLTVCITCKDAQLIH